MKFKFLYLFLFSLIFTISCKEDPDVNTLPDKFEEYEDDYYVHKETVKILKDELLSFVRLDNIDESVLVFDANTPKDILPKKGDIIFIDRNEKFPNAYIGKVVRVENINGEYMVETVIPALTEVFRDLSIDTLITPNPEEMLVFDANGNPVDFEVLDNFNPDDYIGDSLVNVTPNSRLSAEWDNTRSIKLGLSFDTKKGLKTEGSVVLSQTTTFGIDINNFKLDYLKYSVNPSIYVGADFIAESEAGFEFNGKDAIPLLVIYPFGRLGVSVPTPLGIPVILHPKYSLLGIGGIKGSVTLVSTIQYQCGIDFGLEKKNRNSSIVPYSKVIDYSQKTPFLVSNLEMEGKAYAGALLDLFVGVYTPNVGVGGSVGCSVGAQADFSFDIGNIEASNPKVKVGIDMDAKLYAALNLFDGMLEASCEYHPVDNVGIWSNDYYLFPNFKDYQVVGEENKANIDYQIEGGYLLELTNAVSHGSAIFDKDENKVKSAVNTSGGKADKKGNRSFTQEIEDLNYGKTYYAAPMVKWMGYEWYGNKYEFKTEGSYTLAFRCASQSYDVIKFNFSLNNSTGNVIDYTTEAKDYDGSPMRVHITAQYDENSQKLKGIFDFYFYNDPSQRRQDGFTVSLASGDSGYVSCSKVINNGGCAAALRIFSSNSRSAKNADYSRAVGDEGCNVGFYNANY